ncbi:hypothetical protein R1flu_006933 [Riccia fluitans]|uniref:Uncharacterized protein n=1 Tax=Riccia fluitans TaxID=41844 RepID=A0ABD1Z049_9MARC
MENWEEGRSIRERVGGSQMADQEGVRTPGEAPTPPSVAMPVGEDEARPNNSRLAATLGGDENFKTMLNYIPQTIFRVAMQKGNQLLAKFREEFDAHKQNLQLDTPSRMTVGGSGARTPISQRSALETITPIPPNRRIKLDWNFELQSLPQAQNNDMNAKGAIDSRETFQDLGPMEGSTY